MGKPELAAASILVASDNNADAALVKQLLGADFDISVTATDMERIAEQFHDSRPDVLVLAFNTLAMADCVRPLIRVVDDDDFQCRLVARMLESEPYRLIFANDGVEPLGALRRLRPDLVLVDLMMPGMDGIAVTRRLKGTAEWTGVRVVTMTGRSEKALVIDSLGAGAADFVVKPFDRDTLVAKLGRALQSVGPPSKRAS